MSPVSILGAGPVGASIAHRLAQRGRIGALCLTDSNGSLARGKALDIRQAGAVERFGTPLVTSDDLLSAVSARVIVVADDTGSQRGDDEQGLAQVDRLLRAGTTAALVFAMPSHVSLMEKVYRDLGVAGERLVGTAASAIVGSVRSLAGLDAEAGSVHLTVVGRPPALVIGWSAATVDGSLLIDRVPAHRLFAVSRALPRLWPPGAYAIASATAEIVEALVAGARRRFPAMTIVDGDLGVRGTAVMLPLELGGCRVLSHIVPSLSPQERTEMLGGLS